MARDELIALWAERDHRYAWRRGMVSDDERRAIIAYRRREAESLDGLSRVRAMNVLAHWRQPVRLSR